MLRERKRRGQTTQWEQQLTSASIYVQLMVAVTVGMVLIRAAPEVQGVSSHVDLILLTGRVHCICLWTVHSCRGPVNCQEVLSWHAHMIYAEQAERECDCLYCVLLSACFPFLPTNYSNSSKLLQQRLSAALQLPQTQQLRHYLMLLSHHHLLHHTTNCSVTLQTDISSGLF